jgi:hypothetical protein
MEITDDLLELAPVIPVANFDMEENPLLGLCNASSHDLTHFSLNMGGGGFGSIQISPHHQTLCFANCFENLQY